MPVSAPRLWLASRLFALLATVGLIAIGMVTTTWGAHLAGNPGWSLPDDMWRTLTAARRLAHLDLGGLYTQPTGLVGFPGAAVILVPVVAVMDAIGLRLGTPGSQSTHGAWLVAGPYEIALCGAALFAADSIADRLGADRWKRAVLAAAGAVALWSVSVRWGHPEDAVAVALLLFGILALSDSRPRGSAWLIGAAVAVQPLVLLALPVVLAAVEPRRLAGFLTRTAAPGAVLLGAAAAANWQATSHAVTSQPNWPAVDHTTPWTSLAPHLSNGAVAAGPARALAILLACGCALIVARRRREAEPTVRSTVRPTVRSTVRWSPEELEELLWWVAVALTLRCVLEPVMVAYYLWPVLAVALVTASVSWSRLASTAIVASALTFVAQASWHGPWIWWGSAVTGLALTLLAAAPGASRPRPARSGSPAAAGPTAPGQ